MVARWPLKRHFWQLNVDLMKGWDDFWNYCFSSGRRESSGLIEKVLGGPGMPWWWDMGSKAVIRDKLRHYWVALIYDIISLFLCSGEGVCGLELWNWKWRIELLESGSLSTQNKQRRKLPSHVSKNPLTLFPLSMCIYIPADSLFLGKDNVL